MVFVPSQAGGSGTVSSWADLLGVDAIDTDDSPYTPAVNKLVYVDLSAGVAGGSVTVNTPSTPTTGDVFGVKLQTISGTNTVTISGTTAGDLDSVLYLANDTYIYQYDGTTWHVIAHHITPHYAEMRQGTGQALSAGARAQLTFDASSFDFGGLVDLTGNEFGVRRPGRYRIGCVLATAAAQDDGDIQTVEIHSPAVSGTTNLKQLDRQTGAQASDTIYTYVETVLNLTATDVEFGYFVTDAVTTGTDAWTQTRAFIQEILDFSQ